MSLHYLVKYAFKKLHLLMHCISILTIEYPGCLNLTSAEERSNVYARLSASLSV